MLLYTCNVRSSLILNGLQEPPCSNSPLKTSLNKRVLFQLAYRSGYQQCPASCLCFVHKTQESRKTVGKPERHLQALCSKPCHGEHRAYMPLEGATRRNFLRLCGHFYRISVFEAGVLLNPMRIGRLQCPWASFYCSRDQTSSRDCGMTRASAKTGMKLVSPTQRGTTCR